MADILIKKSPHWMDSLTQEEIDKLASENKHFIDKYNRRLQVGDIVDVFPDGRIADTQHGNGQFLILRVPGMSVEEARNYKKPVCELKGLDDDEEPIIEVKKLCKCNLELINLPEQIKDELNTKYCAKINRAQFIAAMAEKTIG